MRQIADQTLPRLKQTTPDVCRETNITLEAFNLNQNSALCLPVVSESRRIIWVHSNQFNLQSDGTAELDKAFNRFPYLTEKQTAALAQRCSLHPDQVKVWFMLQRLRYGISWDYKDIQEVRRKVRPKKGKDELQNRVEEEINKGRREQRKKTEVDESSENEAQKDGEALSRNEGWMEEIENDSEQFQEFENNQEKRGKKRMKRDDEGTVEKAEEVDIRSDQVREEQKSFQSETTVPTRKRKNATANNTLMSIQQWPGDKSYVVNDEPLDVSPLLYLQPQAFNVPSLSDNLTEQLKGVFPTTSNCHMIGVNSGIEEKPEMEAGFEEELQVDLTNHNAFATDVDTMKELSDVNSPVVVNSSCVFTQQQDSHVVAQCSLPSRTRCTTKTPTQLAMMKMAFSHCQYPDSEDYDRLTMLIGIPRYELVQWFGDMRYYIKKGRPRWMTQEEHSKALANIRYRQCLSTLAKTQPVTGSESYGENERMNVALEEE